MYFSQEAIERKLVELRKNRDKLDEAYVYQSTIDADTYNRMKAALLSDITLAEMELRDAALDAFDAEQVVNYGLDVLVNASNLWKPSSVDDKQRYQQVLFPEGLESQGGSYRTITTCLLFNGIEIESDEKRFGSANGNRTRI